MIYKVKDLLSDKISGDWGDDGTIEDGVKVIRTANFLNDGNINYDNLVYRKIKPSIIESKKMHNGDIIIEKSGGSPNQPVGRVVYFENETDDIFLCNNFTTCLRPNKDLVYPKYLFYILFENYKNGKTLRYQNKTTGIINLKLDNYLEEKFDVPDNLHDQIRIAEILSRTESLIAKRKESIHLLDDLVKGLFLDMFGDPMRNEKGWDKVDLNKFGEIITGNTPPRTDKENYSEKYIEWIKTDNIISDEIFITYAAEYLSESGFKKSRFVTKGALLVACIAGSIESIGRAALTDRKVCFNQQINAVQPFDGISPLFIYWLFKMSKSYIQSHATKGMKKILTKGDFEKIKMIKPPIELQNKFASIVEKVEATKAKYRESLSELEALYGSLSQRAFKGELDLSRVPLKTEVYKTTSKNEINNKELSSEEMKPLKYYSSPELLNIIQSLADSPFDFNTLMNKVEQFPFADKPKYEKVKAHIFQLLDGPESLLQQTFEEIKNKDGKTEKKILLSVRR